MWNSSGQNQFCHDLLLSADARKSFADRLNIEPNRRQSFPQNPRFVDEAAGANRDLFR
jgi:hypothetical protein